MIPSSLSEIKALIKSIHIAEKNNQNCPICNSNLTQVGVMWDRPIYGHDCECLLELDLAEAEAEYIDDTDDIIAYYSHINSKKNNIIRCHKGCGKTVDLEDPNCVEDPPYRFRCKICGESLRTHPEYGEGELYDLAKKNITWNFVNRKPTLFNQPFPNQIMM